MDKFSSYALGRDLQAVPATIPGTAGTPGTAMRFRAGTNTGMPNPLVTQPVALNARQRAAGVRVHFTNTATFEFVFGTLSSTGCCQRIWFAGNSNIPGECPPAGPDPNLLPPPPPSPTPPPPGNPEPPPPH